MIINNIKIILPDSEIENGSIEIQNDRIVKINNFNISGTDNFDGNKLIAIPGLIDLHIHGAGGISITDKDDKSLKRLSDVLVRFGITGFLWTTMAVPVEEMDFVMRQASEFENPQGAVCLGVNIEGSFISDKRAGSHLLKCIFEPSINLMQRWIDLSKNNIKIVTIAPEKTSEEFIQFLKSNNIIPSIGHSHASYDQTIKALEYGACYFTHLGNATGMIHQREPGLVGAALIDDNSVIEIICDGFHLHPAIVKIFLKTKGWKNTILVSDGTCVMGMSPGRYQWYDSYATFDGESLKLEDDTIAGGVQPLNKAVKNVRKFTDCSLSQAIYMASLLPARKLSVDNDFGSLEAGKKANIVLIDENYDIKHTFVNGKLVYSA